MPYIKPISGHTTLGAAQRYLERDGRTLARDFINLDPQIIGLSDDGEPVYGAYDWASTMDTTRAMLGNDTSYKGRKARTYKHYVFSPDPRDGIGLSELRSVTMSWVRENFGDYKVAIVYHDDNEHHIPHAHFIVNNTNLDTGRRLQDPDPRALKRSAQRIAREHGLTHCHGRMTGTSSLEEMFIRIWVKNHWAMRSKRRWHIERHLPGHSRYCRFMHTPSRPAARRFAVWCKQRAVFGQIWCKPAEALVQAKKKARGHSL